MKQYKSDRKLLAKFIDDVEKSKSPEEFWNLYPLPDGLNPFRPSASEFEENDEE